MMAGAMRESVDILMEPNRDTNRSSHGTVAARATGVKSDFVYRVTQKNCENLLLTQIWDVPPSCLDGR